MLCLSPLQPLPEQWRCWNVLQLWLCLGEGARAKQRAGAVAAAGRMAEDGMR